jgi:hypothetical protein
MSSSGGSPLTAWLVIDESSGVVDKEPLTRADDDG